MNRKSNGAPRNLRYKNAGQPTDLQHKNLGVSGVKIVDATQGIVEAFVAGIGNKDNGKDIIQPGAFVDSLKARNPKCCWSHDWKQTVGKVLDIHEVDPGDPHLPANMQMAGIGGLYAKIAFNLNTTRGRDAYEDVKFFGDEGEWSIGYDPVVTNYSKDLDANLLHKIDLYEISPVAFGMNPLTSTVSVKAEVGDDGDVSVNVRGVADQETTAKIVAAAKGIIEGKDEDSAVSTGTGESETTPVVKTETKPEDTKVSAETKAVKTVTGSYEERTCALSDALEDLYDGYYVWIRATFDSNVIYEVMENTYADAIEDAIEAAMGTDSDEEEEESKEGTWAASYTMNGDTAVIGTPTAVDLREVVVAKFALIDAIAKGQFAQVNELTKALGIELEVEEKAGRVLSKKNRDKIASARDSLHSVLQSHDAADYKEDEVTPEVKPEETDTTKSEEAAEIKAAIASHSTATSDSAWDGSAAWKNLPQEAAALRDATAWVDSEGDADKKSSYKFIHHFVSSDGKVGDASTVACSTGIGVLNGGRSGTTIPTADKKGVYNHLVKHLKDAGKDELPELKSLIEALAKELGIEPEEEPEKKAYEIRKHGDQYCVHNQDTGDKMPGGCHPTRSEALSHMRALYANVPDAGKEDEASNEEKEAEELPVEVTLDEVTEEKSTESEDLETKESETSESLEEKSDEESHEYKALEGLDEDETAPCDVCGEVKSAECHPQPVEMVEIDSLKMAELELLLAEDLLS